MERLSNCVLCGNDKFFQIGSRGTFQSKVSTVVCRRCGLVFERHRMDDAQLSEFYRGDYHSVYSKKNVLDVEAGKEKSIDRFAFLEGYHPVENKKILEIGCANGVFLKLCKDGGCQVLGVEPDKDYADVGRSHYGVDVFPGTLASFKEEINVSEEKFDVICLFHVLEHLPDPIAELKWFRKKLNTGGLLYLEVPNTISLWRWFKQSPRKFLRPVHFYNFTWSTIEDFVNKSGLHITAKDKSVSRRIRILAEESNEHQMRPTKGDRPFLVILFFRFWKFLYPIVYLSKAVLNRLRKMVRC